MPVAAAIYARISSDDGTAAGVQRQLIDCRQLAEKLGWLVAEEYVDNDVSAYSGKLRPQYEQMMADLGSRFRDGVICYHPDRLTRRPIEFEQFLSVVDAAQIRDVRFVTGDFDVGSGDGLFVARILAAMSANESATKSRRIRRKMDENAVAGRPHGGSRRPFGYEDDRITPRSHEAAVIRTLADRYLAGESARSLTRWLRDSGVKTVTGAEWNTGRVLELITSPRNAGLRQHRGEVLGPACWPAIITPKQRDRALAQRSAFVLSGRRTNRRYLLSGMLRCGRCGHTLYTGSRNATRRYICQNAPEKPGCGRLTVVAEGVEGLLVDAVLLRLDTPLLAQTLAGGVRDDSTAQEAADEIAECRRHLDELAGIYADRQITMQEWLTARDRVEKKLREAERQLGRLSKASDLAEVLGHGEQLRAQWSTLNLGRQTAIVRTLLDHAVVAPGTLGARTVDPERVAPVWRL